MIVAVVGTVAPFAFGLFVTMWLLPDSSTPTRLFLAATLCATSVGITARVLKDLGKLQTSEARIILGAAVVDDVLGLVVLAVVVGIVATGQIDVLEIGRISLLAGLYLGAVLLVNLMPHYRLFFQWMPGGAGSCAVLRGVNISSHVPSGFYS